MFFFRALAYITLMLMPFLSLACQPSGPSSGGEGAPSASGGTASPDEPEAFMENAMYLQKVKHLEAFLRRFNLEEDDFGRTITGEPAEEEKARLLSALFDREYFEGLDSAAYGPFFSAILSGEHRLSLDDDYWYAGVTYESAYLDSAGLLTLAMKLQYDEDGSSRWVAAGAMAGFMKGLLPFGPDGIEPLSPEAHELRFLRLTTALEDPANLPGIAYEGYGLDYLGIACFLMQSGALKTGAQQKAELCFLQVPGWAFTVQFMDRASPNSGWLITGLEAMDDAAKNQLLIRELGITRRAFLFDAPLREKAAGEAAQPLSPEEAYQLVQDYTGTMSRLFRDVRTAEQSQMDSIFGYFNTSHARINNDLEEGEATLPLWNYLEKLTDRLAAGEKLELLYQIQPLEAVRRSERNGQAYALVEVRKTLSSSSQPARATEEAVIVDLQSGRIDQVMALSELQKIENEE